MFEQKKDKVVSFTAFVTRVFVHVGFAFLLILAALIIGIAGYHWVARLSWVDSFLNASMILGGMGPVNTLNGNGAKIFAAMYALFSGLVFVGIVGIVLTPVVHRIIHKFHVDED